MASLLQLSVTVLAALATAQAAILLRQAVPKPPLRLMPLGASITEGYLSTDGNGYRNDLRNFLIGDGFSVDMVGSRKDGNMTDNDDEGWSGFRISQVEDKAKLPVSVPKYLPNLVALNAGTNDCVQNFDVGNAGERMEDLLEYLWQASPGTTIVLSTLIINLNATINACTQDVNAQFLKLYDEKAQEGKRIVFADMQSPAGPQTTDMADSTHPNDGGYLKMAKIWFQSIEEASSKGFLQPPVPLP